MRFLLFVILAVLAFGYALGRFHVAGHVVDWCCGLVFGDHRHLGPADVAACTIGVFLLMVAFVIGPRRTWRAVPRSARLAVMLGLGWCTALTAGTAFGIWWAAK